MISSMIKLFALIHFGQVLSIVSAKEAIRGRLEKMLALRSRHLLAGNKRQTLTKRHLLAGRRELRITSASYDSGTGR